MNFSKRYYQKELLDNDNIPFADIKQNMVELDFINKWLGGHAITIEGFKRLVGKKKKVSVCEIGCGGGDNLIAINSWCKKNGIELNVTGIDIKKECIDFAKSRSNSFGSVNWMISDYKKVGFSTKPDIIFSSLFCHHFSDNDLIYQLQWMKQNSEIGFFINDLQRHPIAYYSIKYLTAIFSKSYLVKNDAPLSVARGFSSAELQQLCKVAQIENPKIEWKWAFRFLILFSHDERAFI
jgi:2-polyprenyl-3-methyl-5-hydroxy-6-metoxy-1,4-benzoquinol methylase